MTNGKDAFPSSCYLTLTITCGTEAKGMVLKPNIVSLPPHQVAVSFLHLNSKIIYLALIYTAIWLNVSSHNYGVERVLINKVPILRSSWLHNCPPTFRTLMNLAFRQFGRSCPFS